MPNVSRILQICCTFSPQCGEAVATVKNVLNYSMAGNMIHKIWDDT